MPMTLSELWPEQAQPTWPAQPVRQLVLDSRQVQPGDVFVALKGNTQADRISEFVQAALSQGAIAILTEVPLSGFSQQAVFYCPDVRQWIGVLTQRLLQAQSACRLPQIAAVTGTNGKTTISRLLAELLWQSGHSSAVMGTTGNGILPHIEPSSHTTVDAIQLQQQLYQFACGGAQYVCLEASSHGLDQGRLAGTPVKLAIFSNLTRDHLDYHGTLENYAQAKAKLFAFASLEYAILNQDDPAWLTMQKQVMQQQRLPLVWTYSVQHSQADFYVQQVKYTLGGAQLELKTPLGLLMVHSPLLGHFNVSNLIAVIAAAMAFGLSIAQIQQAVPKLQGAPGRMQVVHDKSRLFVVDYAHTPDALTQVLSSLRHHLAAKARLWVVFGCGGNRDRGKRPLMTQTALALADHVVLTADNPRHEQVEQILVDMMQGMSAGQQQKLVVQPDRRLAIGTVVKHAQPQDIVVIAGKGHEDYQEIDGVRHWFDDVVELKAALSLNNPPQNSYPA
ncbi:UDP-N-acetylmuramoyl-L-alanyl-D-glutamate--2,6-diaminopimelate ligase [Alkanindiges sp. WGS2144]|uniref:UDP-N-acetylmuramoyl-L-alanyl-D-glutamate--2, 6-diaminopimelate ligase n=1 Tax=Alkanindiges sp. WGS2144 TaxID=3366808 RepID=UPI0037532BE1